MRVLFSKQTYIWGAVVILLITAGAAGVHLWKKSQEPPRETAKVTRGDVSTVVSVSGSIRTRNTARLGFARSGTIAEILVREGDAVKEGQVLATLGQSSLISEYESALARLALVKARRDEERTEKNLSVLNAESELIRVKREQDELVENARRTFLSSDLAATPLDKTNSDTPPTITGTYACTNEGTYTLDVYRSSSESGYAFRLSGLESGGSAAYTGSPGPLGTCGLFIEFTDGVAYGNKTWTVAVPNTQGDSYTANLNAYNIAKERRTLTLEAAEEDLSTAKSGTLGNGVETEAARRAEAEIREAEADVQAAEAKIADDTIRAPFAGIVTSVDLSLGEVSTVGREITVTANDAYELKARIPEIDIAKITVGNPVRASFVWRTGETVPGVISFISPLPTLIDGVAYFEAYIALPSTPAWMMTGLNADVDIILNEAKGVLTLPRRFVVSTGDSPQITIWKDGNQALLPIRTGHVGNDGMVEVFELEEGAEVLLP